jgi:hypothetical protein
MFWDIEEEQTIQWTKEKVQKDTQRSTKHTHRTKDLVTRNPLRSGGELMCSGRVSSTCSTSDIRRVNLFTNPVISHEWGQDRNCLIFDIPPLLSGLRVTRSLVLCVCFVDRCVSFCTFSFVHYVVCSSSIHGFWFPLWYVFISLTFK